jgi:DNA-binding FrmR family transcriptional regulator
MPDRDLTDQARTRLRRIEGQVRGLQHMLDSLGENPCAPVDGEACERLITQVLAVRAAVERCAWGDLRLDEEASASLRAALKRWARLASAR